MTEIVFDIETDGLLDGATTVHMICLSVDGGEEEVYHTSLEYPRHGNLLDAVARLDGASVLIGHNIQGFDIPALEKLMGWGPTDVVLRDTLILSRVLWSDIRRIDGRVLRGQGRLHGGHSLKAWGARLKFPKGDHSDWSRLSQEMIDYCVRDVRLTQTLWNKIKAKALPECAADLEHQFSAVLDSQMRSGFLLDIERTDDLIRKLQVRRAELDQELQEAFPPVEVEYVTPKKRLVKTRTVVFNPGSRQQIAARLTDRYGWKPEAFTPSGQAQVDESVLSALACPEAKLLAERMMVQKRLGSVTEGAKAWLKFQGPDGRVRGYVNHCGTNTHRVTHSRPNMSQVTSVDKPWGKESRACWVAGPGMKLVGADASGIEARWFAHFLVPHDGGRFRDMVLSGVDIHERNAEILELPRRLAKNWFYAFMYGAQAKKLGEMAGVSTPQGHLMRKNFLHQFTGLGALLETIERTLIERGMAVHRRLRSGNMSLRLLDHAHLRAVDGRPLPLRSTHAALNTLIQGNAAVMMKKAVVLAHESIQRASDMRLGEDYHQVGFFHDEMQLEVPESKADAVGRCLVRAMEEAGRFFNTRCPMTGEYTVGNDWSETH